MNKMIPSEIIHADESDNAVIGKNLEIDGSIKLNGGIEPIHIYEIQADSPDFSLIVLFEEYDSVNETFCGFGFLKHEGDSIYPGFFDYSILNGVVTYFHGVFESHIFDFNGTTITDYEIPTA